MLVLSVDCCFNCLDLENPKLKVRAAVLLEIATPIQWQPSPLSCARYPALPLIAACDAKKIDNKKSVVCARILFYRQREKVSEYVCEPIKKKSNPKQNKPNN